MSERNPDRTDMPARRRDGLLRRDDFTPERMDRLAAEARKIGQIVTISEDERERALGRTLERLAGGDAWVFGYGSLMWNPAIHVAESRKAVLRGFHRHFCLSLHMGRGSLERPGLMLGLDRGGSCVGVAHRIAAKDVASEMRILWLREMMSGAYRPAILNAVAGAEKIAVLAFVINRAHPRYEGRLDLEIAARRIARAEGMLGTNRDYLYRAVAQLDALGMRDGPLHRLERRVRALAGETKFSSNEGETR